MNIISFVCCLFVYLLCCNFIFNFNMNVSECTPHSVGDIFLASKQWDCLYILVSIFHEEKKWSDASKMYTGCFVRVNRGWSLKRKDGQTGSGLMDDLHTTADISNDISFARFLAGCCPAGPSPHRQLSLLCSTSRPIWIYAFLYSLFLQWFLYWFLFHVVPFIY